MMEGVLETDRQVRAMLSVQRALRGAVVPALRGVAVDWGTRSLKIVGYFDGEIPESTREDMEVVASEVNGDFPDDEVRMECVRIDSPAQLENPGHWAYRRHEL